jgi:hypothetical protein
MSEEKKEGCCGSGNSGCGCCGGVKKLIFVLAIGLIIFTCGYIMGKGKCPFGTSACVGKMCPLPVQK